MKKTYFYIIISVLLSFLLTFHLFTQDKNIQSSKDIENSKSSQDSQEDQNIQENLSSQNSQGVNKTKETTKGKKNNNSGSLIIEDYIEVNNICDNSKNSVKDVNLIIKSELSRIETDINSYNERLKLINDGLYGEYIQKQKDLLEEYKKIGGNQMIVDKLSFHISIFDEAIKSNNLEIFKNEKKTISLSIDNLNKEKEYIQSEKYMDLKSNELRQIQENVDKICKE